MLGNAPEATHAALVGGHNLLTRSAFVLSKRLAGLGRRARGTHRQALSRWLVSVLVALALMAALDRAVSRRSGRGPAGPDVTLELLRLPAQSPATTRSASAVAPARSASALAKVEAPTAAAAVATPRVADVPQPRPPEPRRAAEIPQPPRDLAEPAAEPSVTEAPVRLSLRTGPAGLEGPAPGEPPLPAEREATGPLAAADGGAPLRAAAPPLVAVRTLDPGFRLSAPVRPRYPAAARRLSRPGTVHVELEVAPDGAVTQVSVQEETPGWGFAAAAREAFATARFTPPSVRGEPVRVRWRKTLHFRP